MKDKILEGQRKNPNKNDLIGGHSPEITNRNPNYAVEKISINPDGKRKDRNLSKIKTSTLFPESWTEEEILNNITNVGNAPAISTRLRDGGTWHRAIVNGVEIDVIKAGENVTSGYPTGTVNASRPAGF